MLIFYKTNIPVFLSNLKQKKSYWQVSVTLSSMSSLNCSVTFFLAHDSQQMSKNKEVRSANTSVLA